MDRIVLATRDVLATIAAASSTVKAAIIIAAALVVYFSPYQSCVRDFGGGVRASDHCARALGGGL